MSDGWDRAEMHVLEELRRLNGITSRLFTCLAKVQTELAAVKVRLAIYGALGGAVSAAAIAIAAALLKG